jgi:hypothetical protein
VSGSVLTRREAAIFGRLTDAVVAPRPPLPEVAQTDAVPAFDAYLRASPALNRTALRAALLALEAGPRALGFGSSMQGLDPARRTDYLARLDRGPLGPVAKALRGLAALCYYGDTDVMRQLGYDADAVVARGRALRAAEGRW